jgi:hypothetical protein
MHSGLTPVTDRRPPSRGWLQTTGEDPWCSRRERDEMTERPQPEGGPVSVRELTIDELERWLLSGAYWKVLDISAQSAQVQFCTCTGEPLEHRRTHDPTVIGYLRTAHPELDWA